MTRVSPVAVLVVESSASRVSSACPAVCPVAWWVPEVARYCEFGAVVSGRMAIVCIVRIAFRRGDRDLSGVLGDRGVRTVKVMMKFR